MGNFFIWVIFQCCYFLNFVNFQILLIVDIDVFNNSFLQEVLLEFYDMLFLHSIFSLSLGCCTGFLQPIVQVTKVSAGLQKSKLDCLAFFCEQWLLGCSVEYHNMGALEVLGNYRLYTHWVWGSTHSGANILELSHEGLSTLTPLINMRTM